MIFLEFDSSFVSSSSRMSYQKTPKKLQAKHHSAVRATASAKQQQRQQGERPCLAAAQLATTARRELALFP